MALFFLGDCKVFSSLCHFYFMDPVMVMSAKWSRVLGKGHQGFLAVAHSDHLGSVLWQQLLHWSLSTSKYLGEYKVRSRATSSLLHARGEEGLGTRLCYLCSIDVWFQFWYAFRCLLQKGKFVCCDEQTSLFLICWISTLSEPPRGTKLSGGCRTPAVGLWWAWSKVLKKESMPCETKPASVCVHCT